MGSSAESRFSSQGRLARVNVKDAALPQVLTQTSLIEAVAFRASMSAATHLTDLRRMVERDVLPRLIGQKTDGCSKIVAVHALTDVGSLGQPCLTALDIAANCENLLNRDLEFVEGTVSELLGAGCRPDRILLDLLAPMASELRRLWSEDLCDYADVILAFCDLGALLRRLARQMADEAGPDQERRIMLTTADTGEDVGARSFGLLLLAELFRFHGWQSWIESDCRAQAAVSAVSTQWFDVVEFIVAGETSLDFIASGIRTLRRSSANPDIGVVVCGSRFLNNAADARQLGADTVALEPLSSLKQATKLVTRLQRLPS